MNEACRTGCSRGESVTQWRVNAKAWGIPGTAVAVRNTCTEATRNLLNSTRLNQAEERTMQTSHNKCEMYEAAAGVTWTVLQ